MRLRDRKGWRMKKWDDVKDTLIELLEEDAADKLQKMLEALR